MSDDENYNSSEDDDYVPSDGEAVSEEENSGDEENLDCLKEDGEVVATGKRKRKTKPAIAVRKRKGGIKLDGDDGAEVKEEPNKELVEQIAHEKEVKKEEHEQKRKNDLWSSFMSDVGRVPPKQPVVTSSGSPATISRPVISSKPAVSCTSGDSRSKIKVTTFYDFAGESVKVTKEVDVTTKEGQAELRKQEEEKHVPAGSQQAASGSQPGSSESAPGGAVTASPATQRAGLLAGRTVLAGVAGIGVKKPAGLGGLLDKINKKPKIGTLEKSKLDWDEFKDKEGIGDELNLHNRSKGSYIEKMNFLQRSDQKQFEIEKSLRLSSSSKR